MDCKRITKRVANGFLADRTRLAWSEDANKTSVDDAYEYTSAQFEENGMDIDELIPDFKDNYKLLSSKLQKALNVSRKEMPVIEPEDMDMFQKRLNEGKIDIFKPYAKGHLYTPDKLSKDEAEEWVELGYEDGSENDDTITAKTTGIPVGDLLPTQSQIWLDKIVESMIKFGVPDSGSPIFAKTIIVSRDGYILDGHHRFAQGLIADPSLRMSALHVPLSIDVLLEIGRTYGEAIGNKPKASIEARVAGNIVGNSVKVAEDISFEEFVDDVLDDFKRNKEDYIERARDLFPEAEITDVEFSGSYGRGNPDKDSDIDLKVYFKGDVERREVLKELSGEIAGYGGVFDIHPEKVNR